jgi:peptide/nickel transport system ATP-binding protein
MHDTILNVCNLSVVFGQNDLPDKRKKARKIERPAVNNVSFQLNRGQVLGIVGESGSGKSVTSLAIMRLVQPPGKIVDLTPEKTLKIEFIEEGSEIPVNFLQLSAKALTQYRGGKIAMIFQEPMSSFNPVYTIGYQVMEAVTLHLSISPQDARQRVIDRLREVRVLKTVAEIEGDYQQFRESRATLQAFPQYLRQQEDAVLKKYPHEFSGGQLQRVMIAMAIACDPVLLIADEPTTALDVTIQKEILILLRDLCKMHRNMSMIFISHDLGVINEIADRIMVMKDGQVVEQGDRRAILEHPRNPYTQGLLACRPTKNYKRNRLPTVEDFIEGDPTRFDSDRFRPISPDSERQRIQKLTGNSAEILLSVRDLSVTYGKSGIFFSSSPCKRAVDNVSFDLYAGETLGIVGESGSGKSTLARAILRLLPSEGNIYYRTAKISDWSPRDRQLRKLRQDMQIVFQNPYNSLDPRMTIGEAIMEPMIVHGKFSNRRQEVETLLAKVRLDPDWFTRYPHQLSGGQRQRVCIARAIALRPSLIICDESVSALDVSVQAEILNLLKDLQQEYNLTYLFISHDISVIRFISDRIIVMKDGAVVEQGAAAEVIERPQADYTKKLMDAVLELPLQDNFLQASE